MTKNNKYIRFIFVCLKIFIYFVSVLFLIGVALLIYGLNLNFGPCVKLPNGIVVAHEAYISFSEPYFIPNVVVKGPDGTIFSRGNDDIFYFSETTAWWVDAHPGDKPYVGYEDVSHLPDSGYEGLAYRPDVGLVSAWKNPELRRQLKREAGPLLEEGKKLRNTNVLGVLTYLIDDPKYRSRDCDIPLFTFEKSYP